jgi:hypothetical protein
MIADREKTKGNIDELSQCVENQRLLLERQTKVWVSVYSYGC